MDPKLLFWTGALAIMGLVAACVVAGIRAIRSGRVVRHRRFMLTAAGLIVLFLASYAGKLWLLGREHLETWTRADVNALRFHETCVAAMLLCGGAAVFLALRVPLPAEDSTRIGVRLHRRAGWSAAVACAFGFASAAWVLWRMFARAGFVG